MSQLAPMTADVTARTEHQTYQGTRSCEMEFIRYDFLRELLFWHRKLASEQAGYDAGFFGGIALEEVHGIQGTRRAVLMLEDCKCRVAVR